MTALPCPRDLPFDVDETIAVVFGLPQTEMTPAERALVGDPAWKARHRAWLEMSQGRKHLAWGNRSWAEISAELRAEHIAEREGRQPGATRGLDFPDFWND